MSASDACWNDYKPSESAKAELCAVPEKDIAKRRTSVLAHLYELRAQLLTASDAASRAGWLLAGFELHTQHDALCLTLANLEKQHPELL